MIKYLLFFTLISSALAEVFRVPLIGLGLTFVDLFASITFSVWIFQILLIKRKIIIPKGFVFLISFLLIGVFSLALNVSDMNLDLSESFNSLSYLIRYFLLSSLILITFNLKEKDKGFIINSIFFTSFVIVILGFLQLKFFPSFEKLGMNEIGWDPHIGRMLSTWFDPNYLGGYFAFVISLGIGVVYEKFEYLKMKIKKNKHSNVLRFFIVSMLFLLFLLLIGIVLTYSRSALLSLMVSVGICGLFLSKRTLFIFSVVLMLAIGSSSRMQERFYSGIESAKSLFISSERAIDPTAKLRIKSWKVGTEIFKENPVLGVGFNTLKIVQKKKWAQMSDSHGASGIDSSMITVMATTGIFGFTAFILFWFYVLKNALFTFLRKNDKYSIGLFAGICGLLVHSIFVNSLFFYAILPTVFIGIGLIKRTEDNDHQNSNTINIDSK